MPCYTRSSQSCGKIDVLQYTEVSMGQIPHGEGGQSLNLSCRTLKKCVVMNILARTVLSHEWCAIGGKAEVEASRSTVVGDNYSTCNYKNGYSNGCKVIPSDISPNIRFYSLKYCATSRRTVLETKK